MNFKLINYKFYSGKYIIYETNIKGKEYDGYDDRLLFEGEYLNGERLIGKLYAPSCYNIINLTSNLVIIIIF